MIIDAVRQQITKYWANNKILNIVFFEIQTQILNISK